MLPLEPGEGFAKFLQSPAWMLADTGEVSPGTPRRLHARPQLPAHVLCERTFWARPREAWARRRRGGGG